MIDIPPGGNILSLTSIGLDKISTKAGDAKDGIYECIDEINNRGLCRDR